ncbi:MAG: SDR family oxidoreductase [Hyphomicrobiales bacterium]|nr:SDR family oxidoreductase [Hyphomicrobiales bacterium]
MTTTRFAGKKALVTGGANGMGRACVEQLAREGAHVYILDKDEHALQALVDECGAVDGAAIDVMDEAGFTAAFNIMLEKFAGRLDVMIHIAGASRGGLLADQTTTDWDWHYRVNLRSHVIGCKLASKVMAEQASGAIVTMSSISGTRGDPGWAGYNAMKAAIMNFTQSIAWELGRQGVRVNAVCPGPVMSERMLKSIEDDPSMVDDYATKTALGRLVSPDEVMQAILFLASDAASAITGQALVIDCGLTARTGQPIQPSIFDETNL